MLARTVIGMVFGVALTGGVAVGCHNDHHDMKSSDPKMMSADVCAKCPGVQHATAEGKCPLCGAKTKS